MTYLPKLNTIYIGYDPKEHTYYKVLVDSIKANTKDTYNIVPIIQHNVRKIGMYWRSYAINEDGVRVDSFDGKPFSTEFSFTRFLVPFLNQGSGYALFMDSDMYVRSDISEVFDRYASSRTAVSVVTHNYKPTDTVKMDGQVQQNYSRKNWSSFVLWNCDHPANDRLTVADVSTKTGGWLHGFDWLESDEIGSISPEWNWLDGHSPEEVEAKNVHFTTGGPMFPTWKAKRDIDNEYATEWRKLQINMLQKEEQ
jgi:hypothetical protein|tara:strand:+ start:8129 stop:8887 length:759 start_codon:yes stop_codon:yes gene_type:complete